MSPLPAAPAVQYGELLMPEKLVPLFTPPPGDLRIRGSYGGRGSAKTRSFATAIAMQALVLAGQGHRGIIVVSRQFANSISDSAKAEIETAIRAHPWMEPRFDIGESYLRTSDGRIEFVFPGLARNIGSIKSKADVLLTWIDEAEDVPAASFEILRPTIFRTPVSELWLSWNPKDPLSAVNQDVRVGQADDPRCMLVEMNWRDNPWFPTGLNEERLLDKRNKPERYAHIWEGAFDDSGASIMIPTTLVLKAQACEVEPVPGAPIVWGLDVGRQGDDSAIAKRQANRLIEPVKAFHRPDTMQVVARVLAELAQTHPKAMPAKIVIDANGMGWGVFDRLQQIKREREVLVDGQDVPPLDDIALIGLNVSNAPTLNQVVKDFRSELYYQAKQWLESGLASMPEDPELMRELCAFRYEEDRNGIIQVESKKDAKKRGVASPNRADAFLLTFGAGTPSLTATVSGGLSRLRRDRLRELHRQSVDFY